MKKVNLLSALMLMIIVAMMSQQSLCAQTITPWDSTFAPWTQGSGTQSDPYQIETPQNLAWLARQVNTGVSTYNGVYFRLTNDLDMNSLQWSPIGNSTTNRFKGVFDGNGHFIDNVYVICYNDINGNSVNETYCGLFGVIENATIVNLGVNTTITPIKINNSFISPTYAGGIVAYVYSGNNIISNCYNTGNINTGLGTNALGNINSCGYSGGIVGYVNSETTLSSCHNFGNISMTNSYHVSCRGGLIGGVNATMTISDCSNSGVINASAIDNYNYSSNTNAGGLVGFIGNGTITIVNSHNDGNVTTGSNGGGLVGKVNSNLSINNCYNTASISATNWYYIGPHLGGLVGCAENTISVINSYNTAPISGGMYLGGLVGYSGNSVSIINSYNKGTLNSQQYFTRYGGGIIGHCHGTAIISLCSNIGSVTISAKVSSSSQNDAYAYSGGIIGYADNTVSLDRCYNTASISGLGSSLGGYHAYGHVGGIVGHITASSNSIHECYNTGTIASCSGCGGISGYTIGGTSISNCYNAGSLSSGNNDIKSPIAYGTATITNCYYLNTCGGSAQTGAESMNDAQMKSTSFPNMLNVGVQAYVMDVSPYVNQGYPIFGDMVYAVSTQAATNVGVTKATLHGTYAGGADVAIFQYRENTTDSEWITVNANVGSPVAYLLTGLQSNTTYIYRFVVQKNGSVYNGEEMTFTTGTCNLIATVTPSSSDICEGESTTLTAYAQSSIDNYFIYNWNTGAATSSLVVSNGGVYTVTVSDTNGCSTTASANIMTHSLPSVSISGNTMLCMGESGLLSASGGNSYAWNTGATTLSIPVIHGGTYSVTVTDTYGCSNSATVTVTSLENLSIVGNTSLCSGQSTTLSVANGTGSYTWSTGDYTPSITVTQAGLYTLTVSLSTGCSSVVSAEVFVTPNPTPSISGNTTVCQGQTTTLTANGGNSYIWSNGSTTSSINVAQSGVYTVTATNAEGCSATTNVTVTVNPLPNVIITGNSGFCQGDNITLTATGASAYAWNNSSTVESITVSSAGTYTVTGTDANGCTNTATKTVTVNPTYNVTLAHSICEGEIYNFYGQNLTVAGTYMHTLQTVNGCDSVLTLTLTVKTLPTPSITGNTSVCEGQSTILTANGGVSYAWSNGSIMTSVIVSQSGVYTATVTNAEGCSASANVTVSVNPLPNITIGGNTMICEGSSTTLTASGADTYSWNTGDNTASVSISSFGVYTVTGTSLAGCSSTSNVTVLVSQLPLITITGETDICTEETTTLTANGGTTYLWSNGTTDASITVGAPGTYQIIGYNEAGCNAMASATVNVWQPASSEFTIVTEDPCYTWNNVEYCESGDYTQTIQTVHGCDSIVTLHLTITVGLDDHETVDFKVYPNPTNGVVNVECTMNNVQLERTEVQVVDMYGKLVRIVETHGRASLQGTIDISDLANGVYFVKLVAEGKTIAVRKVVKQ